jgi:hypothetical protein
VDFANQYHGHMSATLAEYRIQATQRDSYLRVEITGERSTIEASIAGWREVGRLVREYGTTRVLVVSLLSGPIPSPEEQRLVMQSLVGCGFEGVRTAFVLQDSRHVAELEHGEMKARELGQESRVFGSEAVAEVWLRYGESGLA